MLLLLIVLYNIYIVFVSAKFKNFSPLKMCAQALFIPTNILLVLFKAKQNLNIHDTAQIWLFVRLLKELMCMHFT